MIRLRYGDPSKEIIAFEYLQMTRYEFSNRLPYQIQLINVGFAWP